MMRNLSITMFLVLAACSEALTLGAMPEEHPMVQAINDVSEEVDVHRANAAAATTGQMLGAELDRHRSASGTLVTNLYARIGDMSSCASAPAIEHMRAVVRGITATELGRDEALKKAGSLYEARWYVDHYAQGVADNIDRMNDLADLETNCF